MSAAAGGKVALITGGARGIGADAGERLAGRGWRVALVDREREAVERRAEAIGERAIGIAADVTDLRAMEAAAAECAERLGGIDAVVANAGVNGAAASVRRVDPAAFEQVLEVNLMGVWRSVRAALPHVVERRGYVLAIASLAAVAPLPLSTAYATSKAGVEAFARNLRMELAYTGTEVGIGYFGFIDTVLSNTASSHPLAQKARSGIPGPLAKRYPVGVAGAAVARGVEARSRRVCAPRWLPALLALRGLTWGLDARGARRPDLVEACRMADAGPE
ncbi:MAG TPA: short-chain dehydrogenase/reductase [Thermoleophilaceae bacterium]|nr:short-chain dehydrogenase/reductase [Thermoleophilaceae bacterium]